MTRNCHLLVQQSPLKNVFLGYAPSDVDVIVVGQGVVGQFVSLLLAQRGESPSSGLVHHPKAGAWLMRNRGLRGIDQSPRALNNRSRDSR